LTAVVLRAVHDSGFPTRHRPRLGQHRVYPTRNRCGAVESKRNTKNSWVPVVNGLHADLVTLACRDFFQQPWRSSRRGRTRGTPASPTCSGSTHCTQRVIIAESWMIGCRVRVRGISTNNECRHLAAAELPWGLADVGGPLRTHRDGAWLPRFAASGRRPGRRGPR
jgi:hypothetical protein